MTKITRERVLQIIDERISEGVYEKYFMGSTWPFGIYKGRDIKDLPDEYLCWNVMYNEDMNPFQLEYARGRLEVCNWDFPEWKKPENETLPTGHYAGHYDGSSSGH
jgi:hypothetical protein